MEDDQELRSLIIQQPSGNQNSINSTAERIEALLQAVLDNDEDELTRALLQSTEEDFRKKHSEHDSRNIVTIACDTRNVSKNIFEILFRHALETHGITALTEERWYYWETIHFAAYNIDVEKLKIIINIIIGRSRINALTIFSENALHVLLEYGKRIESFPVQLSNGWESRLCHVVAQEPQELVNCARELIKAGIDINHVNIWNETPLIIAIRYRLITVIELLLGIKDVDLDIAKDQYSKKSARELLREHEICVHLLNPTISLVHVPTQILFNYLKSGDEESFVRYKNGNIRQYSNDIDGDKESNTSGNMLQLCLIRAYIEYEKNDALTKENDKDIMKTSMLKLFCQKGFVRCVEHLLNNGAEVTRNNRIFNNLNVFQIVVKHGYYPFLAVLLQHKSNQIGKDNIINALENIGEESFVCETYRFRHVLYLLTSKLESFYQSAQLELINYDSRAVLNDILDLYIKYNVNSEYDENIRQVLRLGASLISTPKDFSRLNKISFETLNDHLDECIDSTNKICYNSLILDEPQKYSETETLHHLTDKNKKRDLLNHPVIIYLIHKKWLQTNKFFKWNIAFYLMFLLSLYAYMVSLQMNDVKPGLKYVFVVLTAIHSLKELLQLFVFRVRYLHDWSNYPEVLIIASCYINIFSRCEIFMVIAILLSTLIFLMMLGQFPLFTKYMIIYSSTKYFLEYAAFYSIQFFSFSLCFFILMPSDKKGEERSIFETVKEICVKLFDTLFFFIGQYDGEVANPQEYPSFGRIIVAIFILCMTIILHNLLVGLIVTDMDVIQKTSKLIRQVKMVKYIIRIETILKRMDTFYCCKQLKHIFGETEVFQALEQKSINLDSCGNIFDNEDKVWLKKIEENRQPDGDFLQKLYEHIVSEVYSEQKNLKGDKDILFKLAQLEEQLFQIRS